MKADEERKWGLLRPHPAEPIMLRRFVHIGVFLVILGFLAAVLVGVAQGLWDFKTFTEDMESETLCCPTQHAHRGIQLQALHEEKDCSSIRLKSLQAALVDPASPHFAFAREKIIEEREELRKLEARMERLQVEPLSREFVITAGLVTLVILLAASAAARLMVHHASEPVLFGKEIASWGYPYWTFVAILFLTFLAREVSTSVIAIDKSWFGWNSFCVSNAAWLLTQVMFLGFAMVIAYPASVLWYLSRPAQRPPMLDPDHPDGAWGVRRHVLVLQTWAILTVVFFFAPTLLALRVYAASPDVSFLYTVPSIVYSAVAAVIVGRLIWNAVRIRQAYYNALGKLGATWQEIESRRPPGDPTINFLGEHWWKLPATIFGALTVLWAVIEWSGVVDRFH